MLGHTMNTETQRTDILNERLAAILNEAGFPVIRALATLAYDKRRAAMFRRELIPALRILDQGHISLADMQGSWAGAMVQVRD